ncbi:uncharacterized protein LOC135078582 [Ostrinia nubilalis]|uniref:uncharacterized protein LOC135078582 n=1 Tax=Ostrinia nubilalis TaxID=29057 RepID=UPI0030826AA4
MLLWDRMRCAPDPEQSIPDGATDDIGRFPWMGIIQHTFYMGGRSRFAVTSGILIHPEYVIASAEDMARIHPETLANTTQFVAWHSKDVKYTVDVKDYTLHPEFVEGSTLASIALVELHNYGQIGYSEAGSPILPICMTVTGAGSLSDLYAIKMTDVKGEVFKEAYKMSFVEDKDCEEFYYKAKLTYKKMRPINPICAVVDQLTTPCVWDGGSALVTRQGWGYWKLVGFGVRGPGCGAPARFIHIHDYMDWIDALVSFSDLDMGDEEEHKLYFRRLSPIKLIMYKGETKIPKDQGQCERKDRGGVLFKDSSEVLVNKNFAQGFYFLTVTQIAGFYCASVALEAVSRSNAAVWLEHHCHRDVVGLAPGMQGPDARFYCASVSLEAVSRSNAAVWLEHHCHRDVVGLAPGMQGPDARKMECFVYYKSKAFLEFRFFFSFRVVIELTMYGKEELPKLLPNPFHTTETTNNWFPTGIFSSECP